MKTILLDKEVYDAVFQISKWYSDMPTTELFEAGDRFHENVADFQHRYMPEFENMYLSHVEFDGVLIAVYCDESGKDDIYHSYTVVSK